jgi:hypothetical protein
MFPLSGKDFPGSSDELGTAIHDALTDVVTFARKSAGVSVEGGKFPAVKTLRIDLSGATVNVNDPPPTPKPRGKRRPGPTVARLEVLGHPIHYEKSKADLELTAKGLSFDYASDARGNPLLVLTEAEEGHVDVKIKKDDLEAMLKSAATPAAREHGVTIQDVRVDLEATGGRSLAVDVRVKAKKMMMSGIVHVRGRADVDDGLVATLSGLKVEGEGMIGTMAAAFLKGHVAGYEGRKVPLMAFSLGDVALRDLKISTKGAIQLTAAFGST